MLEGHWLYLTFKLFLSASRFYCYSSVNIVNAKDSRWLPVSVEHKESDICTSVLQQKSNIVNFKQN